MQDITHQNLEADLVNASLAQPVLLDIWAPWCGPCKTLGPTLEKLEVDYAGRFKLVKLNADEEPEIAQQLSQMFGVRSIPVLRPLQGRPAGRRLRRRAARGRGAGSSSTSTCRAPTSRPPTTTSQAAEELLAEGDTDTALDRLQAALATNPANDTARYDYLRALLDAGRVADARAAFDPVAASPVLDPRLAAAGHWIAAMEAAPTARPADTLDAALAANKRDFDARFELAQRHFAKREFTQAMDELLEILMRDKAWNDEVARKTYVAILQLMTKAAVAPKARSAEGARSRSPASRSPRRPIRSSTPTGAS